MISCGVVPILIGPLQILLVILGGAAVTFGGLFLALFRPAGARKALRIVWRQKIPVLAAAAFVWAAAFGVPRLRRGGGKAAAPGFVECRMFRGGPERRGCTAIEPAIPDPMLGEWNWAFAREARTFYSSPAVDGRHVYIASAEKKVFSDSGNIFCLDSTTGEEVWRDNLKGYRATFSSPAAAGDVVVCGEGLHYTADARIVCLDRRTGAVRWEHRTASHVESSPCIYNGKVYVGAGDDGIYCLALAPESPPAAQIIWHKSGADYPDAESAPAALDGKVYIGLGLGGRAVCCLDAETGDEIWRTATPYPVWSAPSVVGGRLFVGMGNGNFVESAEEVWAATLKEMRSRNAPAEEIAQREKEMAPGGAVWCVDATSGRKIWEFPLPQAVLGAVAAGKDRLYFGCSDGYLYCLSLDGKLLGRWNAGAAIVTSPALAERHIYVATKAGILYCLDAATLEVKGEAPLYRRRPGATDFFLSSPFVAGGRIYVGTPTEGVLCLGQPAKRAEPIWAGLLGGPGQSGRADASPLPERLELAWTYSGEDATTSGTSSGFQVTGAPALFKNALYVPGRRGETAGILKLALADELASPPTAAWFKPLAYPVLLSPAAAGDTIYVVDGKPGDKERALHALHCGDGREIWTWPVAGGASGEFTLGRNRILIAGAENAIVCVPSVRSGASGNPRPLWICSGGRPVGSAAEFEGRVAAVFANPHRLVLLDAETGSELWSRELATVPATGPVFSGETILVGHEKGLSAWSVLDGRCVREWPGAGSIAWPIVVAGDKAACVNTSRTLHLVDLGFGEIVKTYEQVASPYVPMLTHERLYFARETGWVSASTDAEPLTATWLRLRRQERVLGPLVAARGCVYFASSRGMVCGK